jgi:putative phage-type endonuclease
VKILDLEQRTPEWHAARLGRVGSSDAADMLATIKTGEAAARRDLRMRLVCARLTGRVEESGFVSAEMQRGTDLEPVARAYYEAETGSMVETIGYVQHDELMAGYSPDGFVGAEGAVEIKVPKTTTHLKYLRDGKIPNEYRAQLVHALLISGREWIDFVSFDDRLPDALSFFCTRLTLSRELMGDLAELDAYEKKLRAFLAEVDTELEALQTLADMRGRLVMAVNA